MLPRIPTHGKPISTGKDGAHMREGCSQWADIHHERSEVVNSRRWVWGQRDKALQSQAENTILFCREWEPTTLDTELMQTSLKAISENRMKDELQREEAERKGTWILICYLCHAYYAPGTAPNTSHVITHLLLLTTLGDTYYHDCHFIDEKSVAKRFSNLLEVLQIEICRASIWSHLIWLQSPTFIINYKIATRV